jgi:hypothetical protein
MDISWFTRRPARLVDSVGNIAVPRVLRQSQPVEKTLAERERVTGSSPMALLGRMSTFVRVVEAGNLSAASRTLGLSLPAISRQIS